MREEIKQKTQIANPVFRIILIGVLVFFGRTFSVSAEEWVELKGCRLVESQSNDADSFVVECEGVYRGETQNRFRLYFVDAAETDLNSDFKKDRLVEQAAYWESTDPDFALKMGLRAEHFVKRLLRGGFSVHTRGDYAPSMGRPRYYAFVRVDGRWLDEILVEQGLVRIYGKGAHLPDQTNANTHRARLRKLERAAKTERRNAWQGSVANEVATEAEFAPHNTVTLRDAWIYSVKDGCKVTVIPKGTTVTVVALTNGTRQRIRFKKNGKAYEGLCEKASLK